MSRFTSRKFLVTVAAVAFAAFGMLSGNFTAEQAADVVKAAVLAYLAAEGVGDAAERFGAGKSE